MSIETRIQAINDHLLDDYSVLTLAGADLTGVNKNIVNLKPTWKERLLYFMNNGTDVVWENWDKVTGEGTSLTLNNTLEAKMKIKLKGNTSQKTTTGKNLFNPNNFVLGKRNGITTTVEDDHLLLNGTADGTAYVDFTISGLSGTCTWGVKSDVALGTFQIQRTGENVINISIGTTWNKSTFDSTNASGGYISITNGTTLTNCKVYFYTESGIITTIEYEQYTGSIQSPNPSYPQDIHVVSGDNTINVTGINIFDEVTELGRINVNTGENVTDNSYLRSKNYIPVQPNTTYYIYMGDSATVSDWIAVETYSKDKTFISNLGSKVNKTTFTTPNNCYFFRFYYASGYGTTYKNDTCINVSNASINGKYYAYKGASYPISLGDNLLDMNNLLVGIYTPSATPTISGSGDIYKSFNLTLKKGTYSLLASSSLYVVRDFSSYDYSGNATLGSFPANTKSTFTITQDATVYFSFRKYDNTAWDSTKDKVWLVEGSGTKPYRQYMTPIELCKIGTYQDKIDKSSGKNLFDEQTELGSYDSNTGQKTVNNNCRRNVNIIKVQPSTTYTLARNGSTFNCKYLYYDTNKSIISSEVINGSITTPSNCYYLNFFSDQLVNDYSNLMLNEGTTALPYEPYGTGWYLKKEIGKVVLNGSENWALNSLSSGSNYLYWLNASSFDAVITNMAEYIDSASLSRFYINNFIKSLQTGTETNNGYMTLYNNASGTIRWILFNYSNATTVEDFKTWLSSNNIILYYQLQNPTYETITDTTLLGQLEAIKKSYDNQTNISQENNDLPFELDVTALGEIV